MDIKQNLEISGISPLTEVQLRKGIQVLNNAFGRPIDLNLDRQTQLWQGFQSEKIAQFRFASIDNNIIGTCGLFLYDSFGWIGFMAVDPNYRNLHIGNKLIHEIIQLGQSMGLNTFRLDATVLGKRVYKNFDFRDQYPVGLYQLNKNIESISNDEYFIQQPKNIPDWLFQKDKSIFGADRSRLLKLVFDQGKVLIGKNHSYAFLIDDRVGPVVAENWHDAVDLISKSQKLGITKITIPHHSELPIEYLKHLGLIEGQGNMCIRMIRGKNINEKNRCIFATHSFSAG